MTATGFIEHETPVLPWGDEHSSQWTEVSVWPSEQEELIPVPPSSQGLSRIKGAGRPLQPDEAARVGVSGLPLLSGAYPSRPLRRAPRRGGIIPAIARPGESRLDVRRRLEGPLDQLLELMELPEGWDSYGSRRIDPRAVASGILLLIQAAMEDVPAPHVCPVPGGGVQLEWQLGRRGLELEALPDGSAQFLKVDGDRMEEGPLSPSRSEQTRSLVRWLRST